MSIMAGARRRAQGTSDIPQLLGEGGSSPRHPVPDKDLGAGGASWRGALSASSPLSGGKSRHRFVPCGGQGPWAPGRSSPAWPWPAGVSEVSPWASVSARRLLRCCAPQLKRGWRHADRRGTWRPPVWCARGTPQRWRGWGLSHTLRWVSSGARWALAMVPGDCHPYCLCHGPLCGGGRVAGKQAPAACWGFPSRHLDVGFVNVSAEKGESQCDGS